MRFRETLQEFHGDIGVSKSPNELALEDIEARRFRIESIPYKGRTIIFVSKEGQELTDNLAINIHRKHGQEPPPGWEDHVRDTLDPSGWAGKVADAMSGVSMVFMWYFLPELERDLFQSRIFGDKAREYAVERKNITSFYEPVEKIAAELNKTVAVANVATGPLFRLYEETPLNYYFYSHRRGAYDVRPSKSEIYIPQAPDAQRMWTADAMAQMIEERVPIGESVMLVAAPAHTRRVMQRLTENPTALDEIRRKVYEHTMFGLQTSTRLWRYTGDSWTQEENIPYLKFRDQVRPYIATGIGAAVGGAYLARRKRK